MLRRRELRRLASNARDAQPNEGVLEHGPDITPIHLEHRGRLTLGLAKLARVGEQDGEGEARIDMSGGVALHRPFQNLA